MVDIANLQIKVDSSQAKKATGDLGALERQSSKASKSVGNMGKRAKSTGADFDILGKSIFTVKNLIGTVLIGSVISFSDEMTNVTARLQNATRTAEEFEDAFRGLSDIAKETGGSISASVDVFQRLSFVRDEINASIDDMVVFTGTVQKFGVVSGASTAGLNAGLLQLGQALSSDVTRAEEFNSIMENIPAVGVAISKEFGVTTGQLRQLVLEGEVLSKDVFQAILNQSEKANEQFEKMPLTIGRATGQLINQFKILIASVNESSGAASGFAQLISGVTEGVKILNVALVGAINLTMSAITGAVQGILNLLNMAIKGLNQFAESAASVFNSISDRVRSVTFGRLDIGQREARQFDEFLPDNEFINEAAANEYLGQIKDIMGTTTSLFKEQEKISPQVVDLGDKYKKLAESLKDTDKDAEKLAKTTEQLRQEMAFKSVDAMEKSRTALSKFGDEAKLTKESVSDFAAEGLKSMEDSFVGIVKGTESVSDGFRNMVDSILTELLRLQVRKNITGPLSGFLDGVIGSAFGGGLSSGATDLAAGGSLFSFNTGGSFKVGGSGGPDSQFVPLNLSPGEIVNVRKGGQGDGMAAPVININNSAPNTNVQAGLSPNGKSIEISIDELTARNITTPGTKSYDAIRRFGNAPLGRG